MAKISLIGAGNIGGTIALLAAVKKLGDIVLFDVVEGVPQGKALDISACASLEGFDASIVGTNSYEDIASSDVIVVTAGLPRKPGMSRDDLLLTNAKIIKQVAQNIKKYSSNAFVIVVTNPLDAMTWLMKEVSGLADHKVVGMAGGLDTSRFNYFLGEELKVSPCDISSFVLGGHGDEMVPLIEHTTVKGKSIKSLLSRETIQSVVHRTKHAGAEIVNLLKVGSAFYSPASAAMEIVESYLKNKKKTTSCSVYLTGEYGIKDLCVGVPVVIGRDGVERIVELQLDRDESEAFKRSTTSVQKLVDVLKAKVYV